MNKAEIKRYIIEEFVPGSYSDEITDDLDLIQHNIIDSLGVLKLVAYLERRSEINIDVEEIDFENFSSVERIYEIVEMKMSKLEA